MLSTGCREARALPTTLIRLSMGYRILSLLCCTLLLVACTRQASLQVPHARMGYVLSGQNVADGFSRNALTLIDIDRMRVIRTVPLPRSWAKSFAVDPEGNVWIGYSGDMRNSDRRVEIYSPLGDRLHTLMPCVDPEAGISFVGERAFIACAENGLSGKVVVLNRRTMQEEQTITLEIPNAPLVLISSAANERAVVVVGLTSGPEEASYSVLHWIDPQTLTVQAQIHLGRNTDIWRILPYQEQFLLLNVGSYRQPREQANDILVFTPGSPPRVASLATSPSPLWGAVDGHFLYAYHNPTWNSTLSVSERWISRTDLSSGQVITWTLPERWDATDLVVFEGKVFLSHWEYWSGDQKDGLYHWDPGTGQISIFLPIADASGIWLPPR